MSKTMNVGFPTGDGGFGKVVEISSQAFPTYESKGFVRVDVDGDGKATAFKSTRAKADASVGGNG